MKLHEYQSKRIFAEHGIPIPQGEVATSKDQAREIAKKLDGPVVIKSQVLVGGRGKAGGVKVAKTDNEAETLADQILGMNINISLREKEAWIGSESLRQTKESTELLPALSSTNIRLTWFRNF